MSRIKAWRIGARWARWALAPSLVAAAACGDVDEAPRDAPGRDGPAPDAPAADASIDAAAACDPRANFGTPMPLAGFATGGTEYAPRLSPDELTLYTSGPLGDGSTRSDLYVATRASVETAFGHPTRLTTSSEADDYNPTVSSDGLTLFFDSTRGGGPRRLYVAARSTTLGEFGSASLLAGVGSAVAEDADIQPFVSADGVELWFSSSRTGGRGATDLWRALRSGAGFGAPEAIVGLSSSVADELPLVSADRLTVYFGSNRGGDGTTGGFDIWTARRTTVDDGFPSPTPLAHVNTAGNDFPTWLSPDGCRLYIITDQGGTYDIVVAERAP